MFFPQNANLHSLRLGVWVLDPRGVPKQKHNTIDTGCCFARHQALFSSWKRYCRSRTHPDWCLVFALCERHWTWKEHVDFLWVCLVNHCDPYSSAHLKFGKDAEHAQTLTKHQLLIVPIMGVSTPVAAKIYVLCVVECVISNYQIIATWQRSGTCPLMTVSQCREPHQIEHHFRIVIVKHIDIS